MTLPLFCCPSLSVTIIILTLSLSLLVSLSLFYLLSHQSPPPLSLFLLLSQLPALRQNPSGSQLRLKAAVLCMITAPSADNMLPVNKSINSRHLFLGKLSSLHTNSRMQFTHAQTSQIADDARPNMAEFRHIRASYGIGK